MLAARGGKNRGLLFLFVNGSAYAAFLFGLSFLRISLEVIVRESSNLSQLNDDVTCSYIGGLNSKAAMRFQSRRLQVIPCPIAVLLLAPAPPGPTLQSTLRRRP